MKLTGAQIVAEVLLDHGVDTVFGYPGGAALNIYDELYKYSDRIRHVMTAHEQGASHAADGYARATGRTGVVFSTSGPGATNLVTGIATAYMDSIPMVAITSNVDNSLIGRDAFQEIYIAGITIPITKMNYFVNDVDDLEMTLRNAFRIANSGRKGPVLVDITKDVTAAKTEFTNKPPLPLDPKPSPTKEELAEAVRLINNAEKPVAYIGGGCISSNACEAVNELISRADIPAVHTLMASGIVSYDNELNLGLVGMHGTVAANRAIDQADLIIALGARFSDRVALNTKKWGRRARILQIDIDASEINKNVHIDKCCVGDVKEILERMLEYVDKAQHYEWHERVCGWRTKERVRRTLNHGMDPKEILEAISTMCDDDTIYVTDVGQHQMWAAQYLKFRKPKKFLTSGGLGTMGFGYGAAIGAQMGKPDCRVVHIQQQRVGYGLPVADDFLRRTLLQYGAASKDGLRQGGGGLRRSRLSGGEHRTAEGGYGRRDEAGRTILDRMCNRAGGTGSPHDSGRQDCGRYHCGIGGRGDGKGNEKENRQRSRG